MQTIPVATAGRPRNADRELRDAALLKVAAKLFIAHGYAKVSLKLIATEARVAARTIYVRYGGKLGLFEAVVTAERDRLLSDLPELTGFDAPFDAFLHEFCHRYLSLINSDEAIAILRMVVAESAQVSELAQTFYESGPGAMRRHLTLLFSQPYVAALFRPELSAELLSNLLLACLLEDPAARLLRGPKRSDEQQVRHAINAFFAAARVCP
jgi:AcrR family transcriptional regulator